MFIIIVKVIDKTLEVIDRTSKMIYRTPEVMNKIIKLIHVETES